MCNSSQFPRNQHSNNNSREVSNRTVCNNHNLQLCNSSLNSNNLLKLYQPIR